MNTEDVKNIVRLTVKELLNNNCLIVPNADYRTILRAVELNLFSLFNSQGDNTAIISALNKLAGDPYINIIFLQYKDNITLERIAEYFNKDVSTIKRNKKRLIKELYRLMDL